MAGLMASFMRHSGALSHRHGLRQGVDGWPCLAVSLRDHGIFALSAWTWGLKTSHCILRFLSLFQSGKRRHAPGMGNLTCQLWNRVVKFGTFAS